MRSLQYGLKTYTQAFMHSKRHSLDTYVQGFLRYKQRSLETTSKASYVPSDVV